MTAATYAEAQAILKRNARAKRGDIITWDAGDGWKGEGYYCTQRKRIVTVAIDPQGFRVI